MSLRVDIKNALKAGVPSVQGRVYPLIMPQDTKKAAIVYAVVNDYGNTGLCGVVATSDITIQVDVYGKTYAESITAMDEAVAALRAGFNVANLSTYEMYEDITLKYRQIISFTLKSYVK